MNGVVTSPVACYKELDKFLASKTVADINRETYLIFNLKDTINKISVSLVFIRDCENIECGNFESCIIEGKGAVFVVPCYWLCVPKELGYEYLTSIIDTFYAEHVAVWLNSTWVDSGNNGNTNNNPGNACGCPCMN